MPAFETMDRYTDALLWVANGVGQRGQPIVSSIPVELKIRLLNKQVLTLDAHGNNILLDGTFVADRDIPMGSILWEGTIDDLVGTGTAPPTSGLLEVKLSDGTKDIKGRNEFFTGGFLKYNDRMPLDA